MSRDTHLVNIYLKIHNKRPLTMEDLRYLAKYDPECFEKTCRNVVYNEPQTRAIMAPVTSDAKPRGDEKEKTTQALEQDDSSSNIEQILSNIRRLERKEIPIADVEADKVKSLLGNLYMELLFPHNAKETFIGMPESERKSIIDKKT